MWYFATLKTYGVKRHGTNIDRDLLEKVFRGYGFDVTVVDDKTLEELETVMESLVTDIHRVANVVADHDDLLTQ